MKVASFWGFAWFYLYFSPFLSLLLFLPLLILLATTEYREHSTDISPGAESRVIVEPWPELDFPAFEGPDIIFYEFS